MVGACRAEGQRGADAAAQTQTRQRGVLPCGEEGVQDRAVSSYVTLFFQMETFFLMKSFF